MRGGIRRTIGLHNAREASRLASEARAGATAAAARIARANANTAHHSLHLKQQTPANQRLPDGMSLVSRAETGANKSKANASTRNSSAARGEMSARASESATTATGLSAQQQSMRTAAAFTGSPLGDSKARSKDIARDLSQSIKDAVAAALANKSVAANGIKFNVSVTPQMSAANKDTIAGSKNIKSDINAARPGTTAAKPVVGYAADASGTRGRPREREYGADAAAERGRSNNRMRATDDLDHSGDRDEESFGELDWDWEWGLDSFGATPAGQTATAAAANKSTSASMNSNRKAGAKNGAAVDMDSEFNLSGYNAEILGVGDLSGIRGVGIVETFASSPREALGMAPRRGRRAKSSSPPQPQLQSQLRSRSQSPTTAQYARSRSQPRVDTASQTAGASLDWSKLQLTPPEKTAAGAKSSQKGAQMRSQSVPRAQSAASRSRSPVHAQSTQQRSQSPSHAYSATASNSKSSTSKGADSAITGAALKRFLVADNVRLNTSGKSAASNTNTKLSFGQSEDAGAHAFHITPTFSAVNAFKPLRNASPVVVDITVTGGVAKIKAAPRRGRRTATGAAVSKINTLTASKAKSAGQITGSAKSGAKTAASKKPAGVAASSKANIAAAKVLEANKAAAINAYKSMKAAGAMPANTSAKKASASNASASGNKSTSAFGATVRNIAKSNSNKSSAGKGAKSH